jgi:isopentenyl-diphosphate delta-isomerase
MTTPAINSSEKFSSTDRVILVNERDEVVGEMDKIEAHRLGGTLHRASSVLLFNAKGEVLLQQRSSSKIVGAGQWANTCCGNVRPGETYEQCAVRRLREELGIENVALRPLIKFQYFAACNAEFSEKEIDQIFVGEFSGVAEPNSLEVQNTRWENWRDFVIAWQRVRKQNSLALLSQRNQRGELGVEWKFPSDPKALTLSPWFVQIMNLPEILEIHP